MAVVLESYAQLFDYNFSSIKEEMYAQFPKEHPLYMRVESSTRPFEKRNYMGGLGLPVRNRDLQSLPFAEAPLGFPSTFTPINYRLGYQIERTAVEDELWGLLASRPKSMLYGSIVIQDMVACDILNNGLSLQPYDIGGTPLFSTTQAREDGLATWSNLINEAQPITVETVFNAVASLLSLLEDSRGLPIYYSGTIHLYVPMINSELWEQAIEVKKSTMNPNTADNRSNAVNDQWNIEIHPLRYATNPDVWYLGWSPESPNYGLVLINRVSPEISGLKPFGDNEDAWYSRLRMRFTAGYENKRGIAAVGAA